jgi:hypothetical protein
MLTPQQCKEFERRGVLHLPVFIEKSAAEALCRRVWDALERKFPVRRGEPGTWNKQRFTGMMKLGMSDAFSEMDDPRVRGLMDQLVGQGRWDAPESWGSLLVTFPESSEPWDIPHQIWHFEYPAGPEMRGLWAVRMFTCLAPLSHAGGATLVVAGSHRLVDKLAARNDSVRTKSSDMRKWLVRSYPWFKELCSKDEKLDRQRRFMNAPSSVDGIEVQVVELIGTPGDTWLMHPWIMHDVSPNCATTPRIVLNTTLYKTGSLAQYFPPQARNCSARVAMSA